MRSRENKKSNPHTIITGSSPSRPAAGAAAGFILILKMFWQSCSDGGVAWAEVQRHITEARTVKGIMIMESMESGERQFLNVTRLYRRDPGKERHEVIKVPEGAEFHEFQNHADLPIEQIIITVQEGGKSLETRFHPETETVTRTTHNMAEDREESRSFMLFISCLTKCLFSWSPSAIRGRHGNQELRFR